MMQNVLFVCVCGVLTEFSIVGGIRFAPHHKFLAPPMGRKSVEAVHSSGVRIFREPRSLTFQKEELTSFSERRNLLILNSNEFSGTTITFWTE